MKKQLEGKVRGLEGKVRSLEAQLRNCEKNAETNAAKRIRLMLESWGPEDEVSATPPESVESRQVDAAAKDTGNNESSSDTELGDREDTNNEQPGSHHALPLAEGPGDAAPGPDDAESAPAAPLTHKDDGEPAGTA